VSVSGISSGGEMAIQLGVAYSSRIMGVAAFAAAPYDCRRPGGVTLNTCDNHQTPDVAPLEANMRKWSGSLIDPVERLTRQKVYLYVGKHDDDISATVVSQSAKLYARFVDAANLKYENSIDAGHMFPTDFDNPYSSTQFRCSNPLAPLANCGFDGAGALLQWIYGPLNERTSALPDGKLVAIDQAAFVSRAKGMDEIAWLYVPKSCDAGAACKLHVHLHGCTQSYFTRKDTLIPDYSGHSRWAETNNIVLLFPQVYPDSAVNFLGCWDSAGIYDDHFDQKGGGQIEAIMAMVTRITSGFTGASKAIEYHHAEFDHYFVTSEADEIAKLDAGVFAGWSKTGESFAVYPAGTAGAVDVCRFFSGLTYAPKSSHFYTTNAAECDGLRQGVVWEFEGLRFAVKATDASGGCAAGTLPLYRMYNNGQGGAPNHRYSTSLAVRASMIAAGWIAEGNGVGVIGCAPAPAGANNSSAIATVAK